MEKTRLSDLEIGEKARVTAISGSGAVRKRIMAMGIVPGTSIEMIRKAPLGDPVEFRLRGYMISLRKEEAALITVRREG